MIYLTSIDSKKTLSDGSYQYHVKLFADTKQEVPDNITGADVDELPDDSSIAPGSIVLTADFDAGLLKTDKTWSWA